MADWFRTSPNGFVNLDYALQVTLRLDHAVARIYWPVPTADDDVSSAAHTDISDAATVARLVDHLAQRSEQARWTNDPS